MKLALFTLFLLGMASCTIPEAARIGPLDNRPEWQKKSPYTQKAQSKRQEWIIDQTNE